MTVKLYSFHYIIDYKDVPGRVGFYIMHGHRIRERFPAIYLAWLKVE